LTFRLVCLAGAVLGRTSGADGTEEFGVASVAMLLLAGAGTVLRGTVVVRDRKKPSIVRPPLWTGGAEAALRRSSCTSMVAVFSIFPLFFANYLYVEL
jgi:hypothetical protein